MQSVRERIRQRRRQMLVHSYIYYELDKSIISDSKWSMWAKELARLQSEYPKESSEVEFSEEFADWDGSTGAFLNFPGFVRTVAMRLLSISEGEAKLKDNAATKTANMRNKRKLF